jgi:sigma-E factor negative regulatory protein RseB
MLFTSMPADSKRFASAYTISVQASDRVAGRSTTLLAIDPEDSLRFKHRLWLDTETGMPLRTQLVDGNDTVLSEIRFAVIDLDAEFETDDFQSEHAIDGYRWIERRKDVNTVAETDWDSDALPVGFERVSVHDEMLRGSDVPATHILYSDGLSNVSVFIEPAAGRSSTTRSRIGGANSFSTTRSGFRITAVGEVPVETAERIALSMRRP